MTLPRSFLLLLLTACATDGSDGTDGDLEPSDVADLPAGDATGSAASGTWMISIRTTSCTTACSATACTVGETTNARFQVIQTNGALTLDAFTRLRGGIDGDGGFLVGGSSMQSGIELIGRMTGTLAGSSLVGEAVVRQRGTPGDCTVVGDVAGMKI
jgi:hypothetical protein